MNVLELSFIIDSVAIQIFSPLREDYLKYFSAADIE